MGRINYQEGFSLVELMVAITLGLLLSAGIITVYLEGKNSFYQNEEIARVQENGRFALRALSREIGMAGFMGGVTDLDTIPAISIATDCGASNWATNTDSVLEIVNDATNSISTTYTCIDTADFVEDSDVVAIKRTSDDQVIKNGEWQNGLTSLVATRLYLRANNGGVGSTQLDLGSVIDDDIATITATDSGVDVWEYYTTIFHLSNDDDGIPNLCYYRLTSTGVISDRECLLRGVQDLQIELGIDNGNDGIADQFVSQSTNPPDSIGGADLNDVVSIRVYVLIRSVDVPNTDQARAATYQLGSKTVNTNDNIYRRVFSVTLPMRNPVYVNAS